MRVLSLYQGMSFDFSQMLSPCINEMGIMGVF